MLLRSLANPALVGLDFAAIGRRRGTDPYDAVFDLHKLIAATPRGRQALLPSERLLDEAVLPSIARVKAGRVIEAGALMAQAVQVLLDDGADVVVLACTDAPLALASAPAAGAMQARCVDTTLALAQATVVLWRSRAGAKRTV